jgi:hypothetical protein
MMLSVIIRPGTKVDCSSDITYGKIERNLFATTFDAIL